MYELSPILAFAATNAELKKRLRENSYGTVEEHLSALNGYKLFTPDILMPEQQVHMGLLMALLFDAQNNPSQIQHIKDVVNDKWMKRHPVFSNMHIPKSEYHTRGTIYNIITGCSRDPHFQGDLLDNPRCAGQFRDDVIEKVHHKTMPVYMDKHGNIKLFFEGSSDTCNIFVEDPDIDIPQQSIKYLHDARGVRRAIVSQCGTQGFKRVEIFDLKEKMATDSSNTWLIIVMVAVAIIIAVAVYISYVTNHMTLQQPGLKRQRLDQTGYIASQE